MTIPRNLSFFAEGVSSTGVLGASNGGSGTSTLTGYLYGNGTSAFTASTTIPTSALSGTISNAQLANSSLTVNGTSISLGGSGTVTAAAGTLTGTILNSTVVSSSLTSVGTLTSGTWNASTIAVSYGGTGLNSLNVGYIPYGNGTSAFSSSSGLFYNGSLGVGTSSPTNTVDILTSDNLGLTVRSSNYSGSFSPSGLGGMALTTNGTYPLIFYINGAERARFFSSGGVSIGNTTDPGAGNLRFNTTGTNGIYFGSSSILTDYETGTWTPTDGSGAGLTFASGTTGLYTKIGNIVYISASVRYPTTADTNYAVISSMPYVMAASPDGAQGGMNTNYSPSATVLVFKPNNNTTDIVVRTLAGGSQVTNASMSGTRFDFSGFYRVN
jgi:hypothetical protein